MKQTGYRLRRRIALIGVAGLILIWATVLYEVERSYRGHLREAEVRTAAQSQIFAEYSESTIKRINELILDLRPYWQGDWKTFADLIQRRQENIADIAFQVAVIDRDGFLAFSNLARPSDRIDLNEREHFRVHKEAPDADRLFISKALKGKVSGKWSIQFTRPIFRNGSFDGVLVVSVSPEQFSAFAKKLQIAGGSIIAVVRSSGEMMARHPVLESSYGQVLKDRPYLRADGPVSGNDRRVAAIDGKERLYGFYKLSSSGLIFVIGEPVAEILAPYYAYRNAVIGVGAFVSILAVFFFGGLIRSLLTLEKVRRELERSKELADAANVAKSRFLATMSHEIRTPLNGVLGMAQLLLMPGVGDEERQDYARTIFNSGQTLLTLLNDILDMSKVEAGKLDLEDIVFDAGQLIHEIGALFAEAARNKGLQLVLDANDLAGKRYSGDPTRLRQMLANLVSNAIKFTERGYVRVDAFELGREGGAVVLGFAVSDTGMGIPPDKLEMLFMPFSQIDSSITRQFGGSGLGLSIVRSLARQMGGDIGVNSRAGEGTCFWFNVRLGVPEAGADSRRAERQPEAPHIAGDVPASRRVLVVEDNATNRAVITAMLRKQGVGVDVVGNGKQAVDAITGGLQPQLVLMDVQMPVMDGLEATRQLRRWEAEQRSPRLPIVALTAGAFQEDHQRCEEAGMDDFLAKPLNVNDLAAVLERWLT